MHLLSLLEAQNLKIQTKSLCRKAVEKPDGAKSVYDEWTLHGTSGDLNHREEIELMHLSRPIHNSCTTHLNSWSPTTHSRHVSVEVVVTLIWRMSGTHDPFIRAEPDSQLGVSRLRARERRVHRRLIHTRMRLQNELCRIAKQRDHAGGVCCLSPNQMRAT